MSSAFDNKWHSSSPQLSEAFTIRIVLCFVAIAIRVYCKVARRGRAALSWDDAFILFAFLSTTAAAGALLWGRTQGGGPEPIPQLLKENRYKGEQNFLITEFVASILDFLTLTLVRISILLFYNQIFAEERSFTYLARGLLAFSLAWFVAAEIGIVFMCNPPSHYWDPVSPGVCHNVLLFYLITLIIEILLDAGILAIPVRPVSKLRLPRRTRWSIMGIFLLGAFVIITNILRLHYTYRPHEHYADLYKVPLWMNIHITAAIICACLPLYKPVLNQLVQMTSYVSQYARSLISLASLERRSDHEDASLSMDRIEGDHQRDQNDSQTRFCPPGRSKDSADIADIRLDPSDHSYVTEVRTTERKGSADEISNSGVIKVDNEFKVV